ncbi:hypothetical protein ACVWXO_001847 [Bradyrhizobium sp. LM2.7]
MHTPDVLVLQEMSEKGNRRATRIRKLNRDVTEFADRCGVLVRTYLRAQIIEQFDEFGVTTKQGIAQTIAKRIPALMLYLPPLRKPWMSEDARMGVFDAAVLEWMYFHGGVR